MAITKRQVAALTIVYAITRGVVEKVKADSAAQEANVDNVVFEAMMKNICHCCGHHEKEA